MYESKLHMHNAAAREIHEASAHTAVERFWGFLFARRLKRYILQMC